MTRLPSLIGAVRETYFDTLLRLHDFANGSEQPSGPRSLLEEANEKDVGTGRLKIREMFLRRSLRSFPRWTKGHRELAETALLQKDIETAHASSLAVDLLSPRTADGRWIRARCFLRAGSSARAIPLLEALVSEFPTDYRFAEELSAAYLGSEMPERAYEALTSVPPEERSPGAEATLRLLSRKLGMR